MLSLQHVMCLKLQDKNCSNFDIAATVYPDAIRAYTGPRQYSHFEKSYDDFDTSYMSFPTSMKANKTDIYRVLNVESHLVDIIPPCAIGEDTDISAFYKHNKHLPVSLHRGIEKHLKQDIGFDQFIREEINCSNRLQDKFVYQGKTLNGDEVRSVIGDIEQYGIYLLAHRLYEEQGITANQDWLRENVKSALDEQYNPELSEKTFKYMNIREDINELITNHDWSKLNDGPVSRDRYEHMYDSVLDAMRHPLRANELDIHGIDSNSFVEQDDLDFTC